ncbi:DUF6030 family protein [Stappia indica]|uniref:Uncharacterized protein n=1 Tax=Stappia indica TaxID=538381 RepID=A0A857CD07_9HYPH|nr:DUF6030 family protein [Stappia indica]QGZ36890.1 hypothetical protein GH266_21770 [Stappia indica]
MAKDAASRGGARPEKSILPPLVRGAAGPGASVLAAMNRRRLLARGLILLAIGSGVAAGALLFLPAPVEPPAPVEAAPPDPFAGLSPRLRARLLDEAPDAALEQPAAFKRVFGGDPRDLCEAISALGVPMSEWRLDPFVAGFWYCVSDLAVIGRATPDGARSSLFVNLRGQSEGVLNTVRIKLNGDNPQTAPAARAALMRVLDAVGERYGWPWPPEFRAAIEQGGEVELEQFGMRLRVLPEDAQLTGDAASVVRLNVILDFPVVDLVAPAEMFAPFAWEDGAQERRRNRPVGGATLRTPPSGDIIFSAPEEETEGERPPLSDREGG